MAYTKVNWENGENGGKKLNKTNLNHMDEGIFQNNLHTEMLYTLIGELGDLETTDISNLVAAINELNKIRYNLTTDGEAVKTGRKVDGKDEYAKRFSVVLTSVDTFTKDLGFSLSDVTIISTDGMGYASNTGSWYPLQERHDTYAGILDSADACYWLTGSNNKLNVKTYNTNLNKVNVNIYFTYNNEI